MKTPLMIFLLSIVPTLAASQTVDELFVRANELYRAGRYEEATTMYEQILAQHSVSVAVYFNLGNCYYRTGKLGPAILAYERAGRLDPSDADVKHNLRLLNLKTVDRIEPVPELFLVQWMRSIATALSPGSAQAIFLSAWVLLFLALAALYLMPGAGLMRVARGVALLTMAIVVICGALLGLQRVKDESRDQAIVIVPTVTAKSSPDAGSPDAFVIHEGLKIRVSDALGIWVKISLPDGKVGWIQSPQCERI